MKREKESYKKQLKNCKSKEEVEKLKMAKMGHYMAEAKEITNNPYIPKVRKYQLLKKMLEKASAAKTEQEKFLQSLKYAKLPDEEKEAGKKEHSVEAQQEDKNMNINFDLTSLSSRYNLMSQLFGVKKQSNGLLKTRKT